MGKTYAENDKNEYTKLLKKMKKKKKNSFIYQSKWATIGPKSQSSFWVYRFDR